MSSDTSNINPFQSPQSDLDPRIPLPTSEVQNRRRRGLRRETTLRAMGFVKVGSVVIFWGLAAWLWTFPQQATRFLGPFWATSAIPFALVILGFAQAAVAAGLMRLKAWACWLQGASSGCAAMVALMMLSQGISAIQGSDRVVAVRLFAGMLLLAVHSVFVFLVLSAPARRVTSPEYARVIGETLDLPVGKIVAFKVGLLSTLWIADLAALGLGLFALE